jgi:hypothetical protein
MMPQQSEPDPNSWQSLCELARNETDPAKIANWVGQAEMAIFRRARELGHDRNETTERQAMNRASHEMLNIRTKALGGHPVADVNDEQTTRNPDEEREEGVNREIHSATSEPVEVKSANEMQKPIRK